MFSCQARVEQQFTSGSHVTLVASSKFCRGLRLGKAGNTTTMMCWSSVHRPFLMESEEEGGCPCNLDEGHVMEHW